MNAQDNIERVLRGLHVLLSKSEPYAKEPSKVIVDKEQVLELLSQLNQSVYDIMDEYELTKQSRDRAEREFRKHGDEIVWDASRKAEDIYAASVMYTDEALRHVQDIMKEAEDSIQEIYAEMNKTLKEERELVKRNQLELKSQLQDLRDTEKYIKLIEDRNREILKEKEKGKPAEEKEASIYANRQTEIKVNQAYFEKMGISLEESKQEEEVTASEVEIMVDLDADYFQWKEGNEEKEEPKPESLRDRIKNLTSGKK